MIEGGVDHGIGLGGAAPQALKIRERAAMNLGARGGECLRPLVERMVELSLYAEEKLKSG